MTVNGSALAVTAPAVTLTADSGNLDAGKSALDATPDTIVANGTAESSITLSLRDVNNNPVSGQQVTFNAEMKGIKLGTVTDNGDGTYSAPLSGTTAGYVYVSANVTGKALGTSPAQVTLTSDKDNLDPTKSTLRASPPAIVANGVMESDITLELKDVNDNPVSGVDISFKSSLDASNIGTVRDHGNGTYSAKLTGLKSGIAQVKAQLITSDLGITAAEIILKGDGENLDAGKSALGATPDTIVANGTEESSITLSLKDVNNNPVSGQTVVMTSSLTGTTVSSVTDNKDGTYSATLTGTKAGTASISVTVNGTVFAVKEMIVTLAADVTTAKVASVSSNKSVITGNGHDVAIVSAIVTDANNNLVAGQTLNWSTNAGNLSGDSSVSDSLGIATVTLVGVADGKSDVSARVTATLNGTSSAGTVVLRTAFHLGGKFYWTQNNHPASTESAANAACMANGGGRSITRADVKTFVAAGGDFAQKSVEGEYQNVYYYLGEEWSTYVADINSAQTGLGAIHPRNSSSYVPTAYACVKD